VMQATPATWQLLLEASWKGGSGLKILCGGEALSRELADRLVACGETWNMYGPTETTIWSATSRVEAGDGPVLIGPPIQNTQFYVLDKYLQPVPIGVPGELHIGGDGVARGYYKRPELTKERFVPDSFAAERDRRMYKTGDLVRYRPGGEIEFLGRLDNQVKIRGFRIELGEIESVLAKHPAVREAVVVARDDGHGLKKLIAYVVADASSVSTSDLRSCVGKSLPDYMIPAVFVFLSSLPLTPNGKVDRNSLPEPDANDPSVRQQFVAPRTPTEDSLVSICAEVLHLDRVSADESLFDLGADSIHLFQIIARAARIGLKITPQQILRLRSVARIASELNSAGRHEQSDSSSEITKVSREQYRIQPAQQPV
jgi:acyl-CoA synthetase (AMP-forming)/AMP-acid ligase II/acyl carrier protein